MTNKSWSHKVWAITRENLKQLPTGGDVSSNLHWLSSYHGRALQQHPSPLLLLSSCPCAGSAVDVSLLRCCSVWQLGVRIKNWEMRNLLDILLKQRHHYCKWSSFLACWKTLELCCVGGSQLLTIYPSMQLSNVWISEEICHSLDGSHLPSWLISALTNRIKLPACRCQQADSHCRATFPSSQTPDLFTSTDSLHNKQLNVSWLQLQSFCQWAVT